MIEAVVKLHDVPAGVFVKDDDGYKFSYFPDYQGEAISLTLPVSGVSYEFELFPSFFDGLLPEGPQLEGLLKRGKINSNDYMRQLIAVGADLVGAVTVFELENE